MKGEPWWVVRWWDEYGEARHHVTRAESRVMARMAWVAHVNPNDERSDHARRLRIEGPFRRKPKVLADE